MVVDAPGIKDLVAEIQRIFASAKLIVGYNSTGFDMKFLNVACADTTSTQKHFDSQNMDSAAGDGGDLPLPWSTFGDTYDVLHKNGGFRVFSGPELGIRTIGG